MITSMTGFGQASLENEKISLNVQVKSVNGRFLETRFRMPREYSSMESELKKMISKGVQRGTIDVSIYRTLKGDSQGVGVVANLPLAQGYVEAAHQLARHLKVDPPKSIDWLLRVQDVIQIADKSELPEWEKRDLLVCFDEALKKCIGEKRREGEAQFKIFSGLLDDLSEFVDSVKKRKKNLDSDLKEKLQERLKTVDSSTIVEPHRLAQEVVFLLEKADIDEEISRAATHIKAYRDALSEKISVGKKLEFYTQELHREINTMGSKTQALDVTLDIIQAKTSVERLREQVQNVE